MHIEAAGPVRRLAVEVSELADDVRRLALSAQSAAGVEWVSVAADAYRRSLGADCAAVRHAAALLDEAAAAVARHATAVEQALADPLVAAKALL